MSKNFRIVGNPNGIIPLSVVTDADISPTELRVFAFFSCMVGSEGEFTISGIGSSLDMSASTVKRSVGKLTDKGLLRVARRSGLPNEYAVWPFAEELTQVTHDPGTQVTHDTGVTHDLGLNTRSDPHTISINNNCSKINAPENKSGICSSVRGRNLEYDDDFSLLWKLYPRKTNKAGAYKKYVATLRAGATHDELLAAVKEYAASRAGESERFTMHGQTFFGPDERWRDFIPETVEFDAEAARIYDEWDANGEWTETGGETCNQNPLIHGYIRPRGPENSFLASDGTPYEINASGARVGPGYWGSSGI